MFIEAKPVRTAPEAHMEIQLINLPVDASMDLSLIRIAKLHCNLDKKTKKIIFTNILFADVCCTKKKQLKCSFFFQVNNNNYNIDWEYVQCV